MLVYANVCLSFAILFLNAIFLGSCQSKTWFDFSLQVVTFTFFSFFDRLIVDTFLILLDKLELTS